jgi:hypothetical protein
MDDMSLIMFYITGGYFLLVKNQRLPIWDFAAIVY